MKNYNYSLSDGICRSPKFEEKGLAQYAINVGVRCGHDCTYCSSRAMLRTHDVFRDETTPLYKKAFSTGFSIVDPDIAKKVAEDAKRIQHPGLVQICTTVDAWAPEAHEASALDASVWKPSLHNLAGRCESSPRMRRLSRTSTSFNSTEIECWWG